VSKPFVPQQNLDSQGQRRDAVSDDFSGDIGLGEDSANHAWIAVGERAHGVVEMHGVAGSGLDSGASLFVIRVGVADSGHDPICNCGADQIQGNRRLRGRR